jgi:hypothetical protein
MMTIMMVFLGMTIQPGLEEMREFWARFSSCLCQTSIAAKDFIVGTTLMLEGQCFNGKSRNDPSAT